MKQTILMLSYVRLVVGLVVGIALVNFVIAITVPHAPGFEVFFRFGMTIPASICVALNGSAIFVLATIVRDLFKMMNKTK